MPDCTEVGAGGGTPRVKRPQRDQIEFRACCWNDLLPEDHQARIVWDYVESLDLSALYERIKAVERCAGQSAIDPRILFALWLYATLRGIGSARELDRRGEHGWRPPKPRRSTKNVPQRPNASMPSRV
ncbi:MAG TPA: hypothetical protein VMY42_08335, partial [Thermoguttaceae bacterium]|nr:hypothetical protein [Thermoguttaceae bacterium]